MTNVNVLRVHALKTWPLYFQPVADGIKNFEVRVNDRDYRVGDILVLWEWDPATQTYTSRREVRKVEYMMQGVLGLPGNLCVMGLARPTQMELRLLEIRWREFSHPRDPSAPESVRE